MDPNKNNSDLANRLYADGHNTRKFLPRNIPGTSTKTALQQRKAEPTTKECQPRPPSHPSSTTTKGLRSSPKHRYAFMPKKKKKSQLNESHVNETKEQSNQSPKPRRIRKVSQLSNVENCLTNFDERVKVEAQACETTMDEHGFLYMTPAKGAKHPYDLHVVRSDNFDVKNYFTMSNDGITRFSEGEPEFVLMKQYRREYKVFTALTQLRIFKEYRIWKALKVWRTTVRKRMVSRRKHRLQENLFILNPLLRAPLLELRRLCFDVAMLKLYEVEPGKTYTLDEFSAQQANQKQLVIEALQSFSQASRELVVRACEQALIAFLENNGFTSPQSGASTQRGAQNATHNHHHAHHHSHNQHRNNSRGGSFGQQDSESGMRPITFTERAAMRTQCRKLTKYIRLADFLKIDTFLTLASQSTQALLTHVSKKRCPNSHMSNSAVIGKFDANMASEDKVVMQRRQNGVTGNINSNSNTNNPIQQPLFVVTLASDSNNKSLRFEPSGVAFKEQLENIIFEALRVITTPERLITHPDLDLFVRPSTDEGAGNSGIGDGVDLEMMIVEERAFQNVVEQISERVDCGFRSASKFSGNFLMFMDQFVVNQDLCESLTIQAFQDRSLRVFHGLLRDYTIGQDTFSEMSDFSDIGLIRIDSTALKAIYSPSPLRCLSKLHELLPQVMSIKCATLQTETSDMNRTLSKVPFTVDEYISLKRFLHGVNLEFDRIESEFKFVVSMHNLCSEFKVPLTDDDNAAVLMLKDTMTALSMSKQLSEDSVGANASKFAIKLQQKIPVLHTRIVNLQTVLNDSEMLLDPKTPVADVLASLAKIKAEMDEVFRLANTYLTYQEMLQVEQTSFDRLDEARGDWSLKHKLWQAVATWDTLTTQWRRLEFNSMDHESISAQVESFYKITMQAERGLSGNQVSPILKTKVLVYRKTMPVVAALRCEKLRDRHWERIHNLLQFDIKNANRVTLGDLMKTSAQDHKTEVETIANEAVQENILEQALLDVTEHWEEAEFELVQYKQSKDCVLAHTDDIIAELDESLVSLMAILNSRFVGPLRANVDECHKKLIVFQETLDEWLACQRTWMYLESIFGAADIQRQLPNESKLFSQIDNKLRSHMRRVADEPHCLRTTVRSGLRDQFQKHNASLDSIQKNLEEYLETKRAAFGRFYFLSNDELLEILAQTNDPQAVQPHLRKCFDALVELDFGDQPKSIDIRAMISPEGERIELGKNLKARGNVEDWLAAVETSMRTTLHRLLKQGVTLYYEEPRKEWVCGHAGQVVLTGAQIAWAMGTESALRSNDPAAAMQTWFDKNLDQLSELTSLVRGHLTKMERKSIVSLVTTDVHARDVIEQLLVAGVSSTGDFVWQQQLRFYWDRTADDCLVRQANSCIPYSFEYQGCTSRLVITPLTDRCWMTLTGALGLKLGAAPAGPAGTGKTESSKDLAKALGIQCIVYNCSDQIDIAIMGKLFSGLAQAGCWICLDEFNRIDIEVLSVVAQQLLTLRQGRLARRDIIMFEGREITLREHHVIVTMNPGYAGRTELPDNLKVLFRPVAMMVPDYSLIAEIMLFAEGFDGAKTLSRKMTRMYTLCSEQLSQQSQYDYGLRAVKSVLVMAGGLMHNNPHLSEDVVLIRAMRDSNLPKFIREDVPLFFGILGDLFPGVKVPYNDTGDLSEALRQQIELRGFQNVPTYVGKLIQLHETVTVRFGSTIVGPAGSGKSTAYRLLADSYTALHESGNANYSRVTTQVVNPKCVSMGVLYGEVSLTTKEWTDGLVSSIMREAVTKDGPGLMQWIVFDGPIDALWIENLNTVLDDNMMLCLANGERIKLRQSMKCLFEVQDLDAASPATVSRLGVLYMAEDSLGWQPYVHTWIERDMVKSGCISAALGDQLRHRVDALFPRLLKFVRCSCVELILSVDIQLVSAFCTLFASLFSSENHLSAETLQHMDPQDAAGIADKYMAFAVIWSLGSTIRHSDRDSFDSLLRRLLEQVCKGTSVYIPARGLVYDYFVAPGTWEFEPWRKVLPKFEFNKALPFFQLQVPTPDTVRFSYVAKWLLFRSKHVFFTGHTGTGKTVAMHQLLHRLSGAGRNNGITGNSNNEVVATRFESRGNNRKSSGISRRGTMLSINSDKPSDDEDQDNISDVQGQSSISAVVTNGLNIGLWDAADNQHVVPIHIGFSAQTSSRVTQQSIEGRLEKKKKTLLGAPAGSKVVVCIDDVNMPQVEEYGAQPPIELLRQFLDFSGFYDSSKLFWKDISDTCLMVAAAPPGGGRNPVSPRFVRHFAVLCMPTADKDTIKLIFSSILGGFLKDFNFAPEVRGIRDNIVAATIQTFNLISEEMRPSPAKTHYTFNLRDLSKVFQGILMVRPSRCSSVETLVKLWIHENMRIFHDRLINTEDKRWFTEQIIAMSRKHLGQGWTHDEYFAEGQLCIYGNFLSPGAEERMYEGCTDATSLTLLLEDYLEEYNSSHTTQMDLVFFRDAIEHLTRICRVLAQPRGNAMLVGLGGSGKQSLSKLAAVIQEVKCCTVKVTRGYGVPEFREELKSFVLQAGVDGISVMFLVTDTQIVDEHFMEDINNLLGSGEIPNLFTNEETDRIIADMRPILMKMGHPDTVDKCMRTFVERVRDNLHIVLCVSPVGDNLRVRCRKFPGLINCCTIDWYFPWPQAALESVAERLLSVLELPNEDIRTCLVQACVQVHISIDISAKRFMDELSRPTYTTPKSYLNAIQLYIVMFRETSSRMEDSRSRLSNGVIKLEETTMVVEQLKLELGRLMPTLEKKSEETEVLLKEVAMQKQDASVVQERVAQEKEEVNKQAAEVSVLQADAQRELDRALPALNKSIKALDGLEKKDITEMKSFAKPPPAVQTVMEAVNLLLGEKTDWITAKIILADPQLLSRLKNFDKDNIPAAVLKKLKKYIEDPTMAVESVTNVSKAATPICMWVHAMDVYAAVAKEVEPKRQLLNEMNAVLSEANHVLSDKQAALAEVEAHVANLLAKCDETLAEKNRLLAEADQTRARLVRAEKLTNGLASEGVRWKSSVDSIGEHINALVGDTFLAAACISYYGPFTGPYRDALKGKWTEMVQELHIPCSPFFSLVGTLGDPVMVREWQICGLPTDSVSTNNALLTTQGQQWPLLIDPQTQANRWIKQKELKANLVVSKTSSSHMLKALEGAVQAGRPFLLEDCGEALDPALEPVIQREVLEQGGPKLIQLGATEMEYNPNFRMYLTTKMSNPHFLPEVCIKVSVINFTVTVQGLEDQLLGAVVFQERPDIEERRTRLVLSMAADKKQLKDIEDKILKMLSDSKGNILDDEELINTLAHSKTTSAIIFERVEESEKTNFEVMEMRNHYRPAARRGSLLYFVIADLGRMDPMYQYSLEYFVKLFKKCLENSGKSDNLQERLKNVLEYLNIFVFSNVCRGLFETHKLLFAFLMSVQIMRDAEEISMSEWNLLVRGPTIGAGNGGSSPRRGGGRGSMGGGKEGTSNRVVEAEDEERRRTEMENESSKGDNYESNPTLPIELVRSALMPICPHLQTLPDLLEKNQTKVSAAMATFDIPALLGMLNITVFQVLLLYRLISESQLIQAITCFVRIKLGPSFVQSTQATMESIYNDMDEFTPCVLVLSTGADPTDLLLRFAAKRGFTSRMHVISLGQGQGKKAEALIEKAARNGDWVLLQNCHLAKSWMPALEAIVNSQQDVGEGKGVGNDISLVHHGYRLFLTSAPVDYFPVSILQSGIKLTSEPPRGLKANLIRSYETVLSRNFVNRFEDDVSENNNAGGTDDNNAANELMDSYDKLLLETSQRLLFGLCFFHATIQERRKFGALGWNIQYGFSDSDLGTSAQQLKHFLRDFAEDDENTGTIGLSSIKVPWDALRYVTGEINYGGRVTDDWDRRTLAAILRRSYSPELLHDSGFSFSQSGTYVVPTSTTYENACEYLNDLPSLDDPEVFGMHSNASITLNTKEVRSMLNTIASVQPKAVDRGVGGLSPDEIVSANATQFLEELPGNLDVDTESGATTFMIQPTGLMDSLATVLAQEIVKFNRLLTTMRTTTKELLQAIQGFVVMSGDLDLMYRAMFHNTVPTLWAAVAYPSLKPLSSWCTDLCERLRFIRTWLREGPPCTFILPHLFFPQGFVTGVLQRHARKYQLAINSLTFQFSVLPELPNKDTVPIDGVVVSGLFLEGARWNTEKRGLEDSEPGVLYTSMSPIHFEPVIGLDGGGGNGIGEEMYVCPLYKTSARAGTLSTTGMSTNFVIAVELPAGERETDHWIWRGVAMLCNLND